MDVVAWSRNLTEEQASERGARLVGKDELFRDSDVISIHMVLGDRSRGLVTSEELALMKDSAFIVNTSRGPIIDHDALVEALQTGTIAGAGLDVYDTEPISDSDPLLSCENTVLSPHLGYVSDETLSDMYAQVIEDLQQYRAGTPVRVVV
jgi:phosphoglycerate dehydrogenase-like enzyme